MKKDIRAHPHNIFLETLFELGFLGLFILLFFIFLILRRLSKSNWRIHKDYRIVSIIILLLLVNAMKSSSLDGQRDLFSFMAIFLIQTYRYSKEVQNNNIEKIETITL